MRAGLYQTKKGLPVFFGSLRSRKSMTLAEISSSTVRDRSSVSGPSSLHFWFFSVPSEDLHHKTGRGGAACVRVVGLLFFLPSNTVSTATKTFFRPSGSASARLLASFRHL